MHGLDLLRDPLSEILAMPPHQHLDPGGRLRPLHVSHMLTFYLLDLVAGMIRVIKIGGMKRRRKRRLSMTTMKMNLASRALQVYGNRAKSENLSNPPAASPEVILAATRQIWDSV